MHWKKKKKGKEKGKKKNTVIRGKSFSRDDGDDDGRRIDRQPTATSPHLLPGIHGYIAMAAKDVAAPASAVIGFLVAIKALSHEILACPP